MPLTGDAKREYQRKWVAQRRAEFFTGKVCVHCGSDEELRLDHIDPAQKIDHKVWSWSALRREAEIAKCQVLCEPCHKIKTYADCYVEPEHGTHSRYVIYRCRCEACRAGHARHNREWRRKRRGVEQLGSSPSS